MSGTLFCKLSGLIATVTARTQNFDLLNANGVYNNCYWMFGNWFIRIRYCMWRLTFPSIILLFSWENSSCFLEAIDVTEQIQHSLNAIILAPFLIQRLVIKRHRWWMQQLMQSLKYEVWSFLTWDCEYLNIYRCANWLKILSLMLAMRNLWRPLVIDLSNNTKKVKNGILIW